MTKHVVGVGAGLAGLRAAEQLRAAGYDGPLTVVGAEAHLPYNLPPLSKEVLARALPGTLHGATSRLRCTRGWRSGAAPRSRTSPACSATPVAAASLAAC